MILALHIQNSNGMVINANHLQKKLTGLILHCKQNVHDLIDNDVNDTVNCITSLYQDAAFCMRVYGNSSCTNSQSGGMLNVIH